MYLWYVVPTGRVVVPTGRYKVLAGKVIIIVSTGRLSLVPTGRVLSPDFFFDNFKSQIASKVSSPNDAVSDNQSESDAMLHQPGDDIVAFQPGYDELQSATPVDETNSSEGNVGINPEVPVFQNILENKNKEVNLRRSSRISKLPDRLNDYVLNNTVRYGLNKYVNHSMLSAENCVFVSSLNKSCEPSSFEEAFKDVNWINAMNNEMHALYENNTWE
ncbi:hypothetical protein Tco_1206997 [Tanacetum coccineum]